MANILYRASATPTVPSTTTVKNSPLTNLEVDANFKSLNNEFTTKATNGANTDITSIGGLTTALTVGQGGTGVKTVTGLVKGNGTGAFTAATPGADYTTGTNALATGVVKNTTGTGALSIAVASDFPTFNQSTTGNAATVTNGVYTTGDQTITGIKTLASQLKLIAGSPTTPSLTFSSETASDTGLYWSADGVMNVACNGAYAGKFASGGNLTMVGSVTAPTFTGNLSGNASSADTATKLNNQSASYYQTALGYTPIQQGGGAGQTSSKVYIGWLGAKLGVQVDATNFTDVWPINIIGAAGNAAAASGGYFTASSGTSPRIEIHKPGYAAYMMSVDSVNRFLVSATNGAGVNTADLFAIRNDGTVDAINTINGKNLSLSVGVTSCNINMSGNASYVSMTDVDSGTKVHLHGNGVSLGFLNNSGSWTFMSDDVGNGHFTGNVVAYWSDKRLKKNVKSKESVGSIIDAFRVVEYDWDKTALDFYGIGIEAKTNQTGLIAQEAQAVFSNAVVVNSSARLSDMEIENGKVSNIPEDEPLLTIDWDVITPLLLKETQDLRKRVLELENSKDKQEELLLSLMKSMNTMSEEIALLKAA